MSISQTRSGGHGPTAQFWITCTCRLHPHMYHDLERAIRSNNIDLFTHTLTRVISLFFATNHVNYSCWLSKFQLDLINTDDTHPGLRNLLENGAFTVRRSNNPFSRRLGWLQFRQLQTVTVPVSDGQNLQEPPVLPWSVKWLGWLSRETQQRSYSM